MSENVLEIRGVSKRFGSTLANDNISLELRRGEIIALLGENGAGKTTLMSILFGHYTADSGEIFVEGKPLPPGRPKAAIRAGIGMVHQHFSLAPNLSVLENVMSGSESLWLPFSKIGKARAKLLQISARFGLKVDPEARVADLSVGERQRVEILKALYNDAKILVLDEPTAVLTQAEAAQMFATLKDMARQGLSLIFISHKLDEVMSTADRVVVLRGGKTVAQRRAAESSTQELAELMVGRAVSRPIRQPATPGKVMLELRDVTLIEADVARLKQVNLQLRAGEILGVIGVSGNGQAALARLIGGQAKASAGEMCLFDPPLIAKDIATLVAAGVGRVPEDRNREGVIGEMALWENAVLERLSRFSRGGLVDKKAACAFTDTIIERFDVRGGTANSRISLLSGGNVQKLILGRNLIKTPRILIAAQPARGLDEGAVAAVHNHILNARKAGCAVLLISEDLEEVMALADRVQAIVGGKLSPSVDADQLDSRRLGLMMAGEWQEEKVRSDAV